MRTDDELRAALDGLAPDLPGLVRGDTIAPQPVRWLWPGRVARGKLTLLAGLPGTGKTTAALDICARVTTGAAWPAGEGNAQPGSGIVLSAEDDAADTLVPRLLAAGAEMRKLLFERIDGEGFTLADIGKLDAMLRGTGAALVVLDPLPAFLGAVDSHKNADVRGVLRPLAEAAMRHDAAVVGITHLSKAADKAAMLRVSGSLAFVAAARAAYLVAADPHDAERRIVALLKNNLARDRGALAYRLESVTVAGIETSRVVWEPDVVEGIDADALLQPVAKASRQDDARQWLLAQLQDGPRPQAFLEHMARDAGLSWATVRRAKDELGVQSRKLDFTGGWTWELPPAEGEPGWAAAV